MKFEPRIPPRTYDAGYEVKVRISDCGRLHLEPDEQVTFTTPGGGEYDVTRKRWGFYATPSLNGRLVSFGLHGVLVRNRDGRAFVLLVERGHEEAFRLYCEGECLDILACLAGQEGIDALADALRKGEELVPGVPRCPCGNTAYRQVFVYTEPPEGEIRFPSAAAGYRRTVLRCPACGHYVSRHDMDISGLYAGEYVDATYGDDMRRVFERIIGLPVGQSDNEGRAQAVMAFAGSWFRGRGAGFVPSLLDVGAGLCVFAWRMRREGWTCMALDPDARAVRHAREVAGVAAVHADFVRDAVQGNYDVVSFNKVLEHVVDPVGMLECARPLLSPGGFVYVELPDGEAAEQAGPEREEFFVDHHHVFSMGSMSLVAAKAGFRVVRSERLREPSGKYTLRGYLECVDMPSHDALQCNGACHE